jgi:hypothetical protein
MKKLFYSIIILIFTLGIYSCSSIHVANKWAAENTGNGEFKTKNILVIARTANEDVRKAFESEMAKQLRAKGFKATESYLKHPNLKPDEKMTEDKKAHIKEVLEQEGYNGVVLSVLKDKLTNVRTTEEGGYYAGESLASYYPAYIPVYSYGFYGSYYSPYAYPSGYLYNPQTYKSYGTYVPETLETETSYSFILETMAYNLDLPEEKQLIAYVTTRIDEPDNVNGTAKHFTQAVLDSFK